MPIPYENYEKIGKPLSFYFPKGQSSLAHPIIQSVDQACRRLMRLLDRPVPKMELILVAPEDWYATPHDDPEEPTNALPYWTTVTKYPSIIIPTQLDPIVGRSTQEKLTYLIFTVLVQAFLESDARPWPEESPLWADEWQVQFAALWLMQRIHGHRGMIMNDLHEQYYEFFEPELDGKTPVTIRGFDWYEDTSEEDFLIFNLLLEQFATDLLLKFNPEILPRFLEVYRNDYSVLLSEDVTVMLARILGSGGSDWLENLVYF
jgi:hypothetical protein